MTTQNLTEMETTTYIALVNETEVHDTHSLTLAVQVLEDHLGLPLCSAYTVQCDACNWTVYNAQDVAVAAILAVEGTRKTPLDFRI